MNETPIPASQAIAALALELPRETPTIDHAAGQMGDPAADPGTGSATGLSLDSKGQAWDAAVHVVPPRKNIRGEWAKKPGNAQRKASGKPPAGKVFQPGSAQARDTPPADAAGSRPQTAERGPISQIGDTTPPPPAGGPQIVPEAAAQTPLEDYKVSAESLSRGFFGGMSLGFGEAWKPEPEELTGLSGAVQRVLFHYQLPKVGPLIELATVLLAIFAKRRTDPETRRKAGGILALFKRSKSAAPRPQAAPGDEEPPAPPEREPSLAPVVVRRKAADFT